MNYIHVIIPVYNAKKYLSQTVQSVLDQPYKGIDIVLVDDGSTDGSSELCDEISLHEERVSVIHQKNTGVSAARNAGIEHVLQNHSDGFIAFLDADDLWCPKVISQDLFESVKCSTIDVIGFSSCSANRSATKCRTLHRYDNAEYIFGGCGQVEFLWARGTFAAHMYNVALLRKYGVQFDVLSRHNEDVIFSAKVLFLSNKIRLIDKVLYIYRTNMDSATHTHTYSLSNACFIPESWQRAADSLENLRDIPIETKCKWSSFCLTTAAIRCLEMVKELSLNGYSFQEIESCFSHQAFYVSICNLQELSLAPWQRQDLSLFKVSPEELCRRYQNQKWKLDVKMSIRRVRLVQYLRELIAFRISIKNIDR